MATTPQTFYSLWQNEAVREQLFEHLPKSDICSVRLASMACCNLVTKRLFLRTNLTFRAHTFTRPERIQALSKIGHHIEHLTFSLPHSDATFLPPLVHPDTGREVSFLYTPHTSMASVLARPKFANTELGELLTQQYPPLFHAASNVPSFINAMKYIPNMRHLTIKTPGQNPRERYRRDTVDYALISLRISIERASLPKLNKLSLSCVHPSAFIYLRPHPGFGCTPSATRRWRQVRKLHIATESWDFYGSAPGLDQLKMMDDFIRHFADTTEKFTFTWLGRKGPCPLALAADPLFAPPRNSQKLFHEVTSPMSPLPPTPTRRPIKFRRLKHLAVRNATMRDTQVADLVSAHQHSVREFDFENVVLINGGSWDDALAPLMDQLPRKSHHWTRYSTGTVTSVIDRHSAHTVDEVPSSPSAAVEAVSKELLNICLEDDEDDDFGDRIPALHAFFHEEEEIGKEEARDLPSDLESARDASLCTKTKQRRLTKRRRRRKPSHGHRLDEMEKHPLERQASHSDDSPCKPRGILHHPTPHNSSPHRAQPQAHQYKPSIDSLRSNPPGLQPSLMPRQPRQSPPPQSSSHSSPHHRRQVPSESRSQLFGEVERRISISGRSDQSTQLFGEITPIVLEDSTRVAGLFSGDSKHSSLYSPSVSSTRLFGEILSPSPEPELTHSPTDGEEGSADEYFRPRTPKGPASPFRGHPAPKQSLSQKDEIRFIPSGIQSLIRSSSDYSDHQSYSDGVHDGESQIQISAPVLSDAPSMPTLLQPTVFNPTAALCADISAVQRDLVAEEAHRRLAEDDDLRVSTLRKAKAAVLGKLSEQFGHSTSGAPNSGSGESARRGRQNENAHSHVASAMVTRLFGRKEQLQARPSNGPASRSTVASAWSDQRSMDVPILLSRA